MKSIGYHDIVCKVRPKDVKEYVANLNVQHHKEGVLCIKCAEMVPYEGNKKHTITKHRGAL